jgi:hypothetical protein
MSERPTFFYKPTPEGRVNLGNQAIKASASFEIPQARPITTQPDQPTKQK